MFSELLITAVLTCPTTIFLSPSGQPRQADHIDYVVIERGYCARIKWCTKSILLRYNGHRDVICQAPSGKKPVDNLKML